MRKKRKSKSKEDNPGHVGLTTDHFDLTLKRLEDVYLNPIKKDVDTMNKSVTKMKICIEIVCVAITGAALIYIITSILNFLKTI